MDTKTKIDVEINGLVVDFMYYDRKECEDLPIGVIEKALKDGEVTVDDMVGMFRKYLNGCVED
jgi:hypothetical protein